MVPELLLQIRLRGFPLQGHVRPAFIVLPFPLREQPRAVPDGDELVHAIELLIVGPVAPLHLAVLFRRTDFRFAMRDAEVLEVPAERVGELGAVVRLDLLDGEREGRSHLLDEVRGALHGVVVVDAENAEPRAVVDGGELIVPLACETEVHEEFHVHLHAIAGDGLLIPLGIPLPALPVRQAMEAVLPIQPPDRRL